MADLGHTKTDKEIAKLEKKILEVYSQAEKDIEEKIDAYNRNFTIKDAIHKQELKEGKITKEEYGAWIKGQVFQGEQWIAKKKEIADTIYNANKVAVSMVNGQMNNVFAINANYMNYSLESGAGVNFGFGIYDSATVSNLIKNYPELLPKRKVNAGKDKAWNNKIINNAVTQGIIQGEPLDKIAKRIAKTIESRNANSTLTVARTSMTSAQNAGRQESLRVARDKGIEVQKEWMSTIDARTRTSHQMLDGQKRPVDEPFEADGYKIMFPGDPEAHPAMVYNCRCTMVGDVVSYPSDKFQRYDNAGGQPIEYMTYKEWERMKNASKPTNNMVNGKDLSDSWERDIQKYGFAIDDIINQQGFNGAARVVSAEEFEQLYVGGDQPLMRRTYSAPDEETLRAYNEAMESGEFYVNCSVGGAKYGQGMYTASVYGEKGTKEWEKANKAVLEEMEHYQWMAGTNKGATAMRTMTLDPSAKVVDFKEMTSSKEYKTWLRGYKKSLSQELDLACFNTIKNLPDSPGKRAVLDEVNKIWEEKRAVYERGKTLAYDRLLWRKELEKIHVINQGYIADFDDADWRYKLPKSVDDAMWFDDEFQALLRGLDRRRVISEEGAPGVYAAMKGYDAIRAQSSIKIKSSTVVVLNRTKLIINGDD